MSGIARQSRAFPAPRCRWTAAQVIRSSRSSPGRRPRDKKPIGPDTLFQIGSNTKAFTAALILKLEAAGKLRLDDTIGRWLPQYAAWRDVTIRSLLNMTSPIPNYSETVEIGEIEVADIHHQFSDKDLIGFVDPANGHSFPPATGWFYSNTNYILAGLIIEAASGLSYEQALTTMILEPLGLKDTFYPDGPHPGPAALGSQIARVPRALYMLQDCLDYQPKPCSVSTLAPLIGKDVRTQNMSWAEPAGAMVSTPHDLALWIRALFEKRVIPETQLGEMTTARVAKDRLAPKRGNPRRSEGLRPCSGPIRFQGPGRRLLVLRGRDARLQGDLRLLAAIRPPHHRRRQQPGAERRGPLGPDPCQWRVRGPEPGSSDRRAANPPAK